MSCYEAGEVENNVLIGLDNYLFLFDGAQKSFAYSTGERRLSSSSILHFSTNIERRYCFLKERNISYLHLIYPSKEVVLTEKVPKPWGNRIQSLFLRGFGSLNPSIEKITIYPNNLLVEKNLNQPVFRVLDTHMTDFGTFVVTQNVLKKWGLQYDMSNFFAIYEEQRGGDLAVMLALKETVFEAVFKPKFKYISFDNRSSLPGNRDNICIVNNPKSLTDKRLLIFGDSFIKYALPFFAPVFRDIVYVRSASFQSDMIELMAPDFVISSNAERYLCRVEPDANSRPSLFKHYGNSEYTPPSEFLEAYAAQFSWRHHRSVYDKWSRKILSGFLSWEDMGVCHPNNCVEAIDLKGGFRAIGVSPSLVFPMTSITSDKLYMLEFDLKSNVDSFATVYFKLEESQGFSETRSIKLVVNKGMNHLQYFFPGKGLRSVLRIDPLECKGKFRIKNFVLRAVE